METNKYYFSFSINFAKNVDLKSLENVLEIKATKLTPLKESKGKNKSAKFYCKTQEYDDMYTDKKFEEFVNLLAPRLKDLPNMLLEYDGKCHFCVVFTETKQKPCLSLNIQTIRTLANIGASYDVDFV